MQLELQYLNDYAGIVSKVGLTANPIADFSCVTGCNAASLGADVSFDTKTRTFTKFNAGLGFSHADLVAALTV